MKTALWLTLGLILCGLATWTAPVYYKNSGLSRRVDNLSAQMYFLGTRYNSLLTEYTNVSNTLKSAQATGQYFYAQASEVYDRWQAERVVSWTLLSMMREAANATNATSEYVSVVIPRWHLEELEDYIANRSLSYEDMEGG